MKRVDGELEDRRGAGAVERLAARGLITRPSKTMTLPPGVPGGGVNKFFSKTMKLNNIDTVPYLTYNSLSEINFINHAFTTRLGGVSTGEFTSMNMAFNRGDNPDSVTENYKRFCKSAGFDYESLVASAQDHHTVVRAVTSAEKGIGIYKPRDMESVDALITNEKGVTLVTYYADCTPLFFVDTKNKAIGLAHAGWRGTVGRIGEKGC